MATLCGEDVGSDAGEDRGALLLLLDLLTGRTPVPFLLAALLLADSLPSVPIEEAQARRKGFYAHAAIKKHRANFPPYNPPSVHKKRGPDRP